LGIIGKVINPKLGRKLAHGSPEIDMVIIWAYGERVVTELEPAVRIMRYWGITWVLLERSHIQSLVGGCSMDLQKQRW